MTRWRQVVSVAWPIAAAVFIFAVGYGLADKVDDLEKGRVEDQETDVAQQAALDELIGGYEVLQQQTPEASLPTPNEIIEDVAEENDVSVEEILPSTLPSQQTTPPTAQPTIIEETLDLAEVRALVEPIVLDVCTNSDVCDGPAGPPGSGETGDSGPEGVPGVTGAPGLPAPAITNEQLTEIVVGHCSQPGNCEGMPGRDGTDGEDGVGQIGAQGEPGRPPTVEEVTQVVVSSCGAGQCFTQAQIDTAMATWCTGSGTCTPAPGPPGIDGQPGATGAPAREVVAVPVSCVQQIPLGEIQCTSEVVYGDAG